MSNFKKSKRIIFILLAAILSLTYIIPNDTAFAKDRENMSAFDQTMLAQVEKLVEVSNEKEKGKWLKKAKKEFRKNLEINSKSTELDFKQAKVYSYTDNDYITVSIPVISSKHYGKVSNVNINFSDFHTVDSYSELLVQKSEVGTFQTVFYIDGVEKYNDISDEPFYTAEEYKEKKENVITPLGLDFNGTIQCLALPSIVGWQLGNICAVACATAVLCIPCLAVATGFGVGGVATCVYENWD
ncbi:hypothetical protein FS935_21985 [Metabacillus litoralis]|uniref:Uncharacterized protein n=1 Tax=Metabacillus litoralis TaxID=152268 RepID=A0A5C6VD78_9BACI|nr:hypothetical protein [Metabacillus litoralis]TXC81575.1 hypothetical protein FS935_21985 [Metabacillus litoralis]